MNNQIQPSEVCVVEASAGSGKTYALARRYLSLLTAASLPQDPLALKGILAITFTNKAAFEMKSRILELLKRLALDSFNSPGEKKELLESLGLRQEDAAVKASLLIDSIMRTYNYFQVQTIDSFVNAILSSCAFKLGLSANFTLRNDQREFLLYSFDRLIDEAMRDSRLLGHFQEFLQNYIHLENKKSWLPKKDILEVLAALLSIRNIYGRDFSLPLGGPEDIRNKRLDILRMMREFQRILPEGANMQTWGPFLKKFLPGDPLPLLEDLFGPFKKEELRMRKNQQAPAETIELWLKIKDSLGDYHELKSGLMWYPYLVLFGDFLKFFREITQREDVMFLAELNSQAAKLFSSGAESIPELYYRIASEIQHVLIDEFQDTSLLQWQNISPIVEEALSKGGSFFYVGDKKQAIYRFRGGESTLFNSLKSQFSCFNIRTQLLNKNYRSCRKITEFTNNIFSSQNLSRFIGERNRCKPDSLQLNQDDIAAITAGFGTVEQTSPEGKPAGYVKVGILDGDNTLPGAEVEIKTRTIQLIKELSGRFSYSEIAVLVRSNQEAEDIASWLIENDIRVESDKTLDIRANPLIKELIAFLSFLNSPIDDLAFAGFIMGDICLKASGLAKPEVEGFIFAAARNKKDTRKRYLYSEFRLAFPLVWREFFEGFFKSVGYIPLYELVITVLGHFKVLENFPQYQGFLMKFLEVIKEQELDNQSLGSFLEYFKEEIPEGLFVPVSDIYAVKVMTIHKAKGLEFPVVILPYFEINPMAASGLNRQKNFQVIPEQDTLNLQYLKRKDYSEFSLRLEALYRSEYRKSFIDELNTLYVACTRPIFELYIFLQADSSKDSSQPLYFIPPEEFLKGSKNPDFRSISVSQPQVIKLGLSVYGDWIKRLNDEFAGESVLGRKEIIQRGEILHCLLSFIGSSAAGEEASVIRQSRQKAAVKYPRIKDWQEYEEVIARILTADATGRFFCCPQAEVYTEKEVVDAYGFTHRIDRLIIAAGEAVIVDFKSSQSETRKFQEQMETYIKIISEIYPALLVSGFLVFLDDLSVKEVKWKK